MRPRASAKLTVTQSTVPAGKPEGRQGGPHTLQPPRANSPRRCSAHWLTGHSLIFRIRLARKTIHRIPRFVLYSPFCSLSPCRNAGIQSTVMDGSGRRRSLDVHASGTFDAAHNFVARLRETFGSEFPIPSTATVFEVDVDKRVNRVMLKKWIEQRRRDWNGTATGALSRTA